MSPHRAVVAGAIVLLAVALLPLPYGYYTLLRIAMVGCSGYCAWIAWQAGERGLAVALGFMALIYNPWIPLHSTKAAWSVINVASIVLLAFAEYRRSRHSPAD